MDESKIFKENGHEMDVDRDQVALAVKKFRLRLGLSQRELGERWGLTRYQIIRVEKAKNLSWEAAYKTWAMLLRDLAKEGGAL